MSELERWASPSRGLVPSRDERTHKKAVERLVNETKFAGLKVDAEAALTGRIMERAVTWTTTARAWRTVTRCWTRC